MEKLECLVYTRHISQDLFIKFRKRKSETNEATSCRAIIKGKSNSLNNSPVAVTNSQTERKVQEEDSLDLKFKQIEDKFLVLTTKLESIHLMETYNQVLGDIAEFKRKQENLQVRFVALYEKCGLSFIEDSKRIIEL